MYLVTLNDAIVHLNNIGLTTTPDDEKYILDTIDDAFTVCKNICHNTTWIDTSGSTGNSDYADLAVSGTTIPLPVRRAILYLVGLFYANREPVSFSASFKIPYTVDCLLQPYINYSIDYPKTHWNQYSSFTM